MKRIILDEPEECGLSVSEQLQENGVSIGDSNFRTAYANIFQLFANHASSYYEVVEQHACETEDDCKCGLCGNLELKTAYIVQRILSTPLITQHTGKFDFDFELQWPRRIPLGSQCVKLIGVPMCLPKMFNSMFKGHPDFKLTDGGLIKIGTVIKNYKSWAYEVLAIPHSTFTRLPLEVMRKYDIHIYLMNNPAYPDECKQQGMQRSLFASSRNAKYGIHRDVTAYYKNDDAWWLTDEPFDSLVTLIQRNTAERIYNDYTQK